MILEGRTPNFKTQNESTNVNRKLDIERTYFWENFNENDDDDDVVYIIVT